MKFIEDYINRDELNFRVGLCDSLINKEKIPNEIKDKIEFICKKMNFYYGDNVYKKDPFQPMMELNNKKSIIVKDLTENDVVIIRSLINYTKDPILLGKIYDVLWNIENKNEDALQTSNIYLQYYVDNRCIKENYGLFYLLKRSLYILCNLKEYKRLKGNINKLLNLRKFRQKDDRRKMMCCIADVINNMQNKNYALLSDFVKKFEYLLSKNKYFNDESLIIIELLIGYYKSNKNSKKAEQWALRYANMCEQIEEMQSPNGYEYLLKAINILDTNTLSASDKCKEKINELMFKRDESQKKLFESFQIQEVDLCDEESIKKNNLIQKDIINHLNKLDSIQQFMELLKYFNPVSKNNIEKKILEIKNKSSWASLSTTLLFGEDKTIVYDSSTAGEKEKEEYEFANYYRYFNKIIYDIVLQPYLFNCKIDEEIESLIEDISSHNLFVPIDRVQKVKEDIMNILKRNIRIGLADLIIQFENGCRNYLARYKKIYPEIRRGSKHDTISLTTIFVDKDGKGNKFRNAICEILGENLTLAIEYLACRSLSSNIRNKYVHVGYGNNNEFFIDEAILAFLLIEAYCLGYD